MKGRKVRAERSASAGSVHTERKTVAPGRRRTAGCGTMASSQRRMQSHRRTRVSLRSAFLSFLFFPFFHFALTPLFFVLFLVYSLRDLSRSFPKKTYNSIPLPYITTIIKDTWTSKFSFLVSCLFICRICYVISITFELIVFF